MARDQRIVCPVCEGTKRVVPLDENFQRTGEEEPCIDCDERGWLWIRV